MTVEFVPHTKRRNMTRARAARIFLARNGICWTCRQQIKDGRKWFIEHPDSLAQGGSDNDDDLWPAHVDCKAVKDAADAKSKAKRDRLVTAGWEPAPEVERQSKWGKRPLGQGNTQHTATRKSQKFNLIGRIDP